MLTRYDLQTHTTFNTMLVNNKVASKLLETGQKVYAYCQDGSTMRVNAIYPDRYLSSMNNVYPLSDVVSFSTTG